MLLFALIMTFQGCNSIAGPHIEGYVVELDEGRFLVTAYDAKRGKLAANNATCSGGAPKDMKIGQQVKVWTRAVDQSYPTQASADKCAIIQKGPGRASEIWSTLNDSPEVHGFRPVSSPEAINSFAQLAGGGRLSVNPRCRHPPQSSHLVDYKLLRLDSV